MTRINRRSLRSESGMATVEYALVTLAAAALAAVLIAIVKSPEVRESIWGVIQRAIGS